MEMQNMVNTVTGKSKKLENDNQGQIRKDFISHFRKITNHNPTTH